MNIKYTIGSFLSIPFLPLMYYQGTKIRASVPRLPVAKGISGLSTGNSTSILRMLTIGESTIAGVGVDTHEEGFTGTLANELASKLRSDISWKVYARSGYTAKKVTEKIIPSIVEQSVGLIVVGLGGNDAFKLNTPKKWRIHIHELIVEIKSKFGNSPIIFTNMPPIKEFPAFTSLIKFTIGNLVEIFGQELNDVISTHQNVYYYAQKISLEDWINRLNIDAKVSDFFSDGVHPSKLTYQIWAKDLSNFMIENNEIKNDLLQQLNDKAS